MEVVKGVQEQVRGMKVRSSVKKLCEGCKVRESFPIGIHGRKYSQNGDVLTRHRGLRDVGSAGECDTC